MTDPAQPPLFPRFVLIGAGVVVAVTILLAAVTVNFIGIDTYPPTAPAVASLSLRFEDRPDGSVAVLDARNDAVLDVLAPGSNGFVRGTLRGLARQRKLEDVGPATPFRLTAYADGRVALEDTGTGRRIDLEAFGQTNLQAFARLLSLPAARP